MWYWRKSEWLNFANAITALYWEGGLWGAPAAVLTVWGFQLPSPWRKRSPNICPQCGYSYPQEDKLESSWGKTMKKKEDRGVEKKKRAQDGSRVHFPGGSTRAQGNCSFRGVGLGGVVYGGLDAAPRARDYTYFSIEEGRSYSSQVVLFYQKGRKQNNTMTTHPLYSAWNRAGPCLWSLSTHVLSLPFVCGKTLAKE